MVEFFVDNGYDSEKIILYDEENSGKLKELIEFITNLKEIDSQNLFNEIAFRYQISSSDLERLINLLKLNKILLEISRDKFSTLLNSFDYNNSLKNTNIVFIDLINNYKLIDTKKILDSFHLYNLKYKTEFDENSIDKNSIIIIASHISDKEILLDITNKLIKHSNKIVYILNNGKNVFIFDTILGISGYIEDFYFQLIINSKEIKQEIKLFHKIKS